VVQFFTSCLVFGLPSFAVPLAAARVQAPALLCTGVCVVALRPSAAFRTQPDWPRHLGLLLGYSKPAPGTASVLTATAGLEAVARFGYDPFPGHTSLLLSLARHVDAA